MANSKNFAIYVISDEESFNSGADFIASMRPVVPFLKWNSLLVSKEEAIKQGKYATVKHGLIIPAENVGLHLFGLNWLRNLPLCLEFDEINNIKVLGHIIIVDVKYWAFIVHPKIMYTDKGAMEYKEGYFYVEKTKTFIQKFLDIILDSNFVVAVQNANTENAFPLDQLHDALGIDPSIKLLPYDANQPATVKNVIRELLKLRHTDEDSQLLLNLLMEHKDTL